MVPPTAPPAPLRYSDLGSSLLVLSVAPHDVNNIPQLTPRFSKRVVSSGGLLNYIWEVIFRLADYFNSGPQSRKRTCLLETLKRTQDSFKSRVQQVSEAYQQYVSYLQDLQTGKRPDGKLFSRARLIISEWNAAMCAPEGSNLKEMIGKANKAFAIAMRDLVGKRVRAYEAGVVQYNPLFEQIAACQKIIDLEENLEVSLPFDVFAKLCQKGCQLDVVDLDTLKAWIAIVNSCWRIDIRTMHRALQAVVKHLGYPDANTVQGPSALAFLEYNLHKHGLEVLNHPDKRHLQWRLRLEQAQETTINGKRYELENRLGPPESGERTDAHLVFPIRGSKRHVLVVGLNEALIGVEAADDLENPGIIPLAMMRTMDNNGRCALYERLHFPLAQYRWKSRQDAIEKAEDRVVLDSLVALLATLARQDKTPVISVQDLMLNAENQLRLRRRVRAGPRYDYDRIVKLAYDASNGSLAIFRHLMEASGLFNHPVVQFYDAIVQNTLRGSAAMGVDEVAARQGLSDSSVRARAKLLSKEVEELWQKCYSDLTLRYDVPAGVRRDVVEGEIAYQILNFYRSSKSAGLLWPSLRDSIVEDTAKYLRLK